MPLQLLSPRSAALPRRHDRPKARLLARVPGHPGLNAERRLKVANIQIVNSWEYHGDPSRTSVESATIPHSHPRGEGGTPYRRRQFQPTLCYWLRATRYQPQATGCTLQPAGCRLPAAFLLYSNHAQLFGCEPFSPSSARPSSRNPPQPSQRDGRVSSLDQARLPRPRLMPERIPAENVSVGQILNRRFVCATLVFLHRKIKGSRRSSAQS
jgi:hypothetical protein